MIPHRLRTAQQADNLGPQNAKGIFVKKITQINRENKHKQYHVTASASREHILRNVTKETATAACQPTTQLNSTNHPKRRVD